MKKEQYRDYVAFMFRFYAAKGEPTRQEIDILRQQLKPAAILDLIAVDNTLRILEQQGYSDIIAAVKNVYFCNPKHKPRKNDISARVTKFAIGYFVTEVTVWRWLDKARKICADERQLQTISDEFTA